MRTRSSAVVLLWAFLAACGDDSANEGSTTQEPEPLGEPLREAEGVWSQSCSSSSLYWDGRRVQLQCFDARGEFAGQNLGDLREEAAMTLNEALANANLSANEPVNHQGGCGAADNQGTVTLWIDGQAVSFEPDCIIEGVVPLYAQLQEIVGELGSCVAPGSQLDTLEPDCRVY